MLTFSPQNIFRGTTLSLGLIALGGSGLASLSCAPAPLDSHRQIENALP